MDSLQSLFVSNWDKNLKIFLFEKLIFVFEIYLKNEYKFFFNYFIKDILKDKIIL